MCEKKKKKKRARVMRRGREGRREINPIHPLAEASKQKIKVKAHHTGATFATRRGKD
jgi:hypothetical protein